MGGSLEYDDYFEVYPEGSTEGSRELVDKAGENGKLMVKIPAARSREQHCNGDTNSDVFSSTEVSIKCSTSSLSTTSTFPSPPTPLTSNGNGEIDDECKLNSEAGVDDEAGNDLMKTSTPLPTDKLLKLLGESGSLKLRRKDLVFDEALLAASVEDRGGHLLSRYGCTVDYITQHSRRTVHLLCRH